MPKSNNKLPLSTQEAIDNFDPNFDEAGSEMHQRTVIVIDDKEVEYGSSRKPIEPHHRGGGGD